MPPAAPGAGHAAIPAGPDAAWWAARTRGYDWSSEDKIDTPAFNRLLWQALAPGRPYPAERSGRDLSLAAENR